jgi:hypothetical protein
VFLLSSVVVTIGKGAKAKANEPRRVAQHVSRGPRLASEARQPRRSMSR